MGTVVPVILAGGSGSRLWPLSRKSHPKQFHPLLVEGASLLEQTALRSLSLADADKVITVTAQETAGLARQQLAKVDKRLCTHIIAEPSARNTAAAVLMAALYALTLDRNAIIWVQPSDHHIPDTASLAHNVRQAVLLADQGHIVTFGVQPQEIAESFGYITAEETPFTGFAHKVRSFIEKPEREVAAKLLQNPHCYVNSGMFVMSAARLLEEARKFAPLLLTGCTTAYEAGVVTDECFVPSTQAYVCLPSQPIDKAIIEKTSCLVVVPAQFSWADIGSWDRLWQVLDKDDNGNVSSRHTHVKDSSNNLILTGTKRTICLGVDNLVIIDTEDMLLIADRSALGNLEEAQRQVFHHTPLKKSPQFTENE